MFGMMPMTFHLSSKVTLLFDFWDVNGPAGMVLSVLVVLLLTVFYEALKMWRLWLSRASTPVETGSPCTDSTSSLGAPRAPGPRRDSWPVHVVQTALHVLQVSLGYMLMLCVMTYNAWVFLGVLLGSTLGYFISFPLLGPA